MTTTENTPMVDTSSLEINVDAMKAEVENILASTGTPMKVKKNKNNKKSKKAEVPVENKVQTVEAKVEAPVVETPVEAKVEPQVPVETPVETKVETPMTPQAPTVNSVSEQVVQAIMTTAVQLVSNLAAQQKQEPQVRNPVVVKTEYPEGTPDIVVAMMRSGMTEKQIVHALIDHAKKQYPEVRGWAEVKNSVGRPNDALKKFYAVKKGVRDGLGIKPTVAATNKPEKVTVSIPTPTNVSVNTGSVNLSSNSIPLKKFVNQKTGEVFLLWSDYLAASDGTYSLRFRKFSRGENSQPATTPPSVYLIRGETNENAGRVVTKMTAEEFVVFLSFINQLSGSGKLGDIFRALVQK